MPRQIQSGHKSNRCCCKMNSSTPRKGMFFHFLHAPLFDVQLPFCAEQHRADTTPTELFPALQWCSALYGACPKGSDRSSSTCFFMCLASKKVNKPWLEGRARPDSDQVRKSITRHGKLPNHLCKWRLPKIGVPLKSSVYCNRNFH